MKKIRRRNLEIPKKFTAEQGMETPFQFVKDLKALRREFHSHPELSKCECNTAAMIVQELQKLSPTSIISSIGGTGVVATFDSGVEGPKVLFRAELDALQIEEVNDFEHKSCCPGVSHKCGHDGHLATVVGVAQLVAKNWPKKGLVYVLFQPAEETGSGAESMLADPAFACIKPDLVFAYHNVPGYPLGQVILRDGAMTASVRSLIIRLHGKTSHAAEPENGISPAPAISRLIHIFENLSNNTTERADFRVITPVHIRMGEVAYGVAAGYGEIHVTIRTWTEPEMTSLINEIMQSISLVTATYKLTFDTEWVEIFVANENKPGAVQLLREAAVSTNSPHVLHSLPFKWGEDFGHFTTAFDGAFFCIGAGMDTPALHNPDYDFPDEILEVGLRMFTGILLNPKLGMY